MLVITVCIKDSATLATFRKLLLEKVAQKQSYKNKIIVFYYVLCNFSKVAFLIVHSFICLASGNSQIHNIISIALTLHFNIGVNEICKSISCRYSL
jgi:hypothetical protein